ncbi:hypothetical protein B0O99DRAFT_634029 [Bisporella sp. PMI_857]|nr:hypothetical protein B0O99DRAFT_634029 [Bisporella sp. PMI_857]
MLLLRLVFLFISCNALVRATGAEPSNLESAESSSFILNRFSAAKVFELRNEERAANLLLNRQQLVCPAYAPVDCGPPGCCRATENCRTEGCCPKTAETCGGKACLAKGQTCCGNGACEVGTTCMTSPRGTVTCCYAGMTACDNGSCCFAGTKCSDTNPGKCERLITSITRLSSTGVSTRSSTVMSQSLITSSAAITRASTVSTKLTATKSISIKCKSTPTFANTKRTAAPAPDGGLVNNKPVSDLLKRQSEEDDLRQFCDTDDEQIPIMYFPWYPGETDQLIESTCAGIGGGDEILLTWAGDGPVAADKRRGQSGCPGYCARIGESINAVYGERNECDEFPPASSTQGGAGAHKLCIVWWQNQLGGKLIQSYKWLYRLQPNQKFIIRVVPGCAKFSAAKREIDSSKQSYTAANSTWHQDRRPGAEDGVGFVFAPMTEVKAGTYNISLDLGSPVIELSITDGNGLEYFRNTAPSANEISNFTVEDTTGDGVNLAIAAYARRDDHVNIVYQAALMPNNTETGTQKSKGSPVGPWSLPLTFFAIVFATVMLA